MSSGSLFCVLIGVLPLYAVEHPHPPGYLKTMDLLQAEFPSVRLHKQSEGTYRAQFHIEGFPLDVDLTPHRVRSPNFKLFVSDGRGHRKEIDLPPETTYRGSPKGMPDIQVAASIQHGKLTALIKDSRARYWTLEPSKSEAPGSYALYRSQNIDTPPGKCNVRKRPARAERAESASDSQTAENSPPLTAAAAAPGTSIAEIAFDTDYEFFVANGSSVADTVADIENVMNGVSLIYENDVQITYDISSINVRTNSGLPYTSTDADLLLDQMETEWKANFVGIPRDIAHLMTGKSLDGSTIGLAYLGVICDEDGGFGFGYGLSQSRFSANFQTRVALTAHELGHNWDANHDPNGHIMCGTIGACSGIIDRFAPAALNSILTFKDSLSCLDTVPDPLPDLQVSKTVDQDTALIGDFLTYTLTVTNSGTTNATGVILIDELPAALTFISSTPASGVTVSNQTVHCQIGNLDISETFTLEITAIANNTGTVVNIATAAANEADLAVSNNQNEATSLILPGLAILEPVLLFKGEPGGPYFPGCASLTLSNRLDRGIDWTLVSNPTWLDISSTNGFLSAGTSDSLEVCVNPLGDTLPIGSHPGTIVLSNQTTGLLFTIPVTLTIAGVAQMPFTEGFESGTLSNYWRATGTADFRIRVTSERNPDTGNYHVTMDDSTSTGFSRNELTLTVNLEHYTNVVLSYRGREFSDEPHPPPTSFLNGADFDGVAVSMDGITWYSVADSTSFSNSYQSYQVDLDTAIAAHGIAYNRMFMIRFNQYDNTRISNDGAAYDNIAITGILKEDIDQDGIPNAWELQHFGGFTNALPDADADGDGLSNLHEYIADTNPTSDVSFLQFLITPTATGSGIELSYESSAGRVYSIFCITNLTTPGITQIQTNEPGIGTTQSISFDAPPPCAFFYLEAALP